MCGHARNETVMASEHMVSEDHLDTASYNTSHRTLTQTDRQADWIHILDYNGYHL